MRVIHQSPNLRIIENLFFFKKIYYSILRKIIWGSIESFPVKGIEKENQWKREHVTGSGRKGLDFMWGFGESVEGENYFQVNYSDKKIWSTEQNGRLESSTHKKYGAWSGSVCSVWLEVGGGTSKWRKICLESFNPWFESLKCQIE